MGKLVKLSLEGQIDSGYKVELVEIKEEGQDERILKAGVVGKLPSAEYLDKDIQNWQKKYNQLDESFRLEKSGKYNFPSQVSVTDCQQAADDLTEKFNLWLESDGFTKIEKTLRTELSTHDYIRFVINTTDDILWKLPWSVWDFFNDYRNAEVALSSSECRVVEKPFIATPIKKVKILAVCGDNTGIDYQSDKKNLKSLRSVGAKPEILNMPTPRNMRDRLWDEKWDILFFAGHGDRQYIHLNKSDKITLAHLNNSLKTAIENGLKIAILNCCDGLELARQLVTEFQIPIVIAMREPVPNKFAQEFLEYFLLEYAYRGDSLYVAVRKARERIVDSWPSGKLPNIDWLPVICQNPAIRPPTWSELHRQISRKRVAGTSLVCTSLVMCMRLMGLLQPLELGVFDHLMRMRPAEKPDERLLVVTVTESDIRKLPQYPISDETMLKLLKKLEQYKPLAIGLDIYRDKRVEPGHKEFAAYLKQNDRVVAICEAGAPDAKDDDKIGVEPPSSSAPENVGFSDLVFDPDGIARRHLFYMNPHSKSLCPVPVALSTELALRYLWEKGIEIGNTKEGNLQIGSVVFNPLENHTGFYNKLDDRGHQVLINYRNPKKIAAQVNLTAVLNGSIRSELVKDRIVLIGVTAESAKDKLPTPYGTGLDQKVPGVLIHAQMVSQMISVVEDKRPLLWFLPLLGDILWICVWSVVGGIVVLYFRPPLLQGLFGVLAIFILGGSCFLVLLFFGGCLPLVPSALALFANGGFLVISTNYQTRRAIERNLRLKY